MSPLSCLPAYFVFGQQHLEVATCAARIAQYAADKAQESEHRALLVFLDQVLLHAISQVQEHVKQIQQVGLAGALALFHVPADGTCFLLSSALYTAGKNCFMHAVRSQPIASCVVVFHQLRQTCNEPSASANVFTMILIAVVFLQVHACPAKGQEISNHLSHKLDCIACAELHQHSTNRLC